MAADAVVIGVGNSWAGDDAVGLMVARALRGRLPDHVGLVEHEGEPTALLELWPGKRLAVVVDAVTTSADRPPGSLLCLDGTATPLPSSAAGRSTHAFTLSQAIELGRALGRLPDRLVVLGIVGHRFDLGGGLDPRVAAAIDKAAARALGLVANY